MSVTAVSISSLTMGTPAAIPAYTEVTALADGATIDFAGVHPEDVILGVKFSGSAASDAAVSITAGDNPPAFRSGLGDIIIAPSGSTANAEYVMSLGDSARWMQSTGKAEITFDADTLSAAYLRAIKLPR